MVFDQLKHSGYIFLECKLVDDKDYSDIELENLNWEGKCRLIQSDPVTCARHFDYQFNQFLRHY